MSSRPSWQPSDARIESAQITAFAARALGGAASTYEALHRWSIEEPAGFWRLVWETSGIVGDPGDRVVESTAMPGARWFPDAGLNFAENLLQRGDETPAIVFQGEEGPRRELSFAELREAVARAQSALRAAGIVRGDRVAGFLPNLPETVIAMLATTSLGAIWSSCSPDFGVQGVVDRFGQIEPRVLFGVDGYRYAGKRHDRLAALAEIQERLPSIERTVVVPFLEPVPSLTSLSGAISWPEFLSGGKAGELVFERFPFDHPLLVLYSSGTTGAPKCIVHGAGGTLLQHAKEHRLHVDLRADDRFFYFTTCGWMMWNWLVSGLAAGATLVLYDGSPFAPETALFDLAERERIDVFGVSAKFLDAAAKAGLAPRETHDLSSVRTILSTGSPLVAESFDYVYDRVKADLCLSSISGGTDIISCFMGGNSTLPVWRGEIQCPGLGMKVEVFDDQGRALAEGKGELVCTAPFPSMPLGFWNDPDGARYRAAYFERFPGVWHHGDYVERTEHGGFVIHGRSDAVLNPGGVRIGTAEIYRQVERVDEVVEGLAIGQEWEGDVRVVLFVVLRPGVELDDSLRDRIRRRVREGASPRHVPRVIVQVPDLPHTKSGKLTELAVRDLVHGRPVKNREALANPEALDHFLDLPELRA